MNMWTQDPDPAVVGQTVKLCLLDAVTRPCSWTLRWPGSGAQPQVIYFGEHDEECIEVTVPAGAIGGILVDDSGYYQDEAIIVAP